MQRYKNLQEKIGIKFKDKALIDNVFVHRSFVNEHKKEGVESNERLEFLGDAVLELVVTEYLYKNYPGHGEGDMTNWRSALVKGKNLAKIGKELELGQYLYLSHGEEKGGGREKNYILANTVEALIGAIYLEKGYKPSHKFISDFILEDLDEILQKGLHIDSKSHFQEIAQDRLNVTPTYELEIEEGPDHNKIFTMGAYIKDELIAKGKGSSKQKAESDAAKKALKKMGWDKVKIQETKFAS